MKIIHFSDIHASCWIDDPRAFLDKRFIGSLNFLLRRKAFHTWDYVRKAVKVIRNMAPDVVVCTGDLTTISGYNEFEKAKSVLLPLVEDQQIQFLYVPGNHDIYVQNAKCLKYVEEIFFFFNRQKWHLNDLPVYYDFKSIRFLLLNQAIPGAIYDSSGFMDDKTNRWLEDMFSEAQCDDMSICLVGHFPIFDQNGNNLSFRRRCRQNQKLQSAIRNGTINIALCGHIHDNFVRRESDGGIEMCAGSLTQHGKLNYFEVDSNNGKLLNQKWLDVK